MAAASRGCTTGCTSNTENEHETTGEGTGDQAANDAEPAADQGADTLAMLAAALVNLSAADRAKLAAMLLHGNDSIGPAPESKTMKPKGRNKAKGMGK